jgi:hypothetical protein
MVIVGTYRELFTAIAGSSGALTGLLFVAMSVAPRPASGPPVIQQIRAAAALLAFTNALAVSLFGLVPDTNIGYPALTLGVIGILFTAAGVRSTWTSSSDHLRLLRQLGSAGLLRQLGLMVLLLLIFGTELANGIAAVMDPGNVTPVQWIGYALVASLLVGIARAWELVGERDAGLLASIAVLAGHAPGKRQPDGIPGTETAGTEGSDGAGADAGENADVASEPAAEAGS